MKCSGSVEFQTLFPDKNEQYHSKQTLKDSKILAVPRNDNLSKTTYIPPLDDFRNVVFMITWKMIATYLKLQILWKELETPQNVEKVRFYNWTIFFLKWHSTSSDALELYTLFHIIHMYTCSYYFIRTYYFTEDYSCVIEIAFQIKAIFLQFWILTKLVRKKT